VNVDGIVDDEAAEFTAAVRTPGRANEKSLAPGQGFLETARGAKDAPRIAARRITARRPRAR
jgi:hypothetical protein